MQDVSDKLLRQFVACLQDKVGAVDEPAAADAGRPPARPRRRSPDEAAASRLLPRRPRRAAHRRRSPLRGPPRRRPGRVLGPRANDDALDLGATVLPILARTYGPQAAIALVALVIGYLLGRGAADGIAPSASVPPGGRSRRTAVSGSAAQRRDGDAGVLAHPGRVGPAELGVDVERVRVQVVAGPAQRPAAALLEQRVLHVLGDQSGDVLAALLPLGGPPPPGRSPTPPGRRPRRGSPRRWPRGRATRGPARSAERLSGGRRMSRCPL